MKPRAVVVLNAAARHGTAERRFELVRERIGRDFDLRVVPTDLEGRWHGYVRDAIRDGAGVALAAGGDGTVGAVASALLSWPEAEHVVLGAVGLGSSNDYHKPFGALHSGVPLRIDEETARPRDVGRAVYCVNDGSSMERAFLVSASVGVTARANAIFNDSPGAVLGFLKRRWVGGAVFYAALAALARHVEIGARVRLDDEEGRFALSNLSVLKTPFLSGCLRYDTPVGPDSGLLAANLCHGMGRLGLVFTLVGLARGRFTGRPRTRAWLARRIEVDLDVPAVLELDGEVVAAQKVAFDILPRRILVCG